MNITCSIYVGASVDGFIAGPDGDIDWLHRPEYSTSETGGLSYEAFMASVDTLIMGRHTYEKALTFEKWPYEQTPVVVLSTRALNVPKYLKGKVRVESCPPTELVARLASEGAGHLYIDGGVTIQRFLRARLIDEITVTYIPILLGTGIPLFGSTGNRGAIASARFNSIQQRLRSGQIQSQPGYLTTGSAAKSRKS